MSEHCEGCRDTVTIREAPCPGIAVAQAATVDVAEWLRHRANTLRGVCVDDGSYVSPEEVDRHRFADGLEEAADVWEREHGKFGDSTGLPPSGEPARQTAQSPAQTALPPFGDSAPPAGDRGLDSATIRTGASADDLMAAIREAFSVGLIVQSRYLMQTDGECVHVAVYDDSDKFFRDMKKLDTPAEAALWLREVVAGRKRT